MEKKDETASREEKGLSGSPAPTGKVSPVQGQGGNKQNSKLSGSPAPTGKVSPVQGQGGNKQNSKPPGSPAPTIKVTPVHDQGGLEQHAKPPGSPAPTGKKTPVNRQGGDKEHAKPPGSPAPTGKKTPVNRQGGDKEHAKPPGSPAPTGKKTPVNRQGGDKEHAKPPGSPAPTGKKTPVNRQGGDKEHAKPPGSPAPTGKKTPVNRQGGDKEHAKFETAQSDESLEVSGTAIKHVEDEEVRRLKVENHYLKKILDHLHTNLFVGESTPQHELKPPEDIQNDQSILEVNINAQKVAQKFHELERDMDFIYRRMSQLLSTIVGSEEGEGGNPLQERPNKNTATGRNPERSPASTPAPSKLSLDHVSPVSKERNEKEREINQASEVSNEFNSATDANEDQVTNQVESKGTTTSKLSKGKKGGIKGNSQVPGKQEPDEVPKMEDKFTRQEIEETKDNKEDSSSRLEKMNLAQSMEEGEDNSNHRKITESSDKNSTRKGVSESKTHPTQEKFSVHDRVNEVEKMIRSQEDEIKKLKSDLKEAEENSHKSQFAERKKLEEEVMSLRTRLSELAGAKLTKDNPDVTDLSDPNRPTKLAEQYSELYSNEWTDMFQQLSESKSKPSEENITKYLLEILLEVFKYCKSIKDLQHEGLREIIFFPARDKAKSQVKEESVKMNEIFGRHLTEAVKLSSEMTGEHVAKVFIERKETKKMLRKNTESHAFYVQKCVKLCWLMQVQTPPVCIDISAKPDDRFDKDTYKEYTKKGKKIDFIVWPPLRLGEGGHLLAKGVAQGK